MNFKTFQEKCFNSKRCFNTETNYHVIVHFSVFEKFHSLFGKSVYIADYSKFWKRHHVHLLVLCKPPSQMHSFWGIKGERIQNERHRQFIIRNFFYRKEKHRHPFLCRFELGIRPLFDMSLLVIMDHLRHFQDLKKLVIPKNLVPHLLKRCEACYQLPMYRVYNRQSILEKTFRVLNQSYEKNWVVWLQNKTSLHFSHFEDQGEFVDLFSFYFESGNLLIPRCLNCMIFEEDETIRIVYKYRRRWQWSLILTDPREWCHVCKQTPLFLFSRFDHETMTVDPIFKQNIPDNVFEKTVWVGDLGYFRILNE